MSYWSIVGDVSVRAKKQNGTLSLSCRMASQVMNVSQLQLFPITGASHDDLEGE